MCDGNGNCAEATCQTGYLDCDGNKANGCEQAASTTACTSCTTACTPQNVTTAVCSPTSGGCTYAMTGAGKGCLPFSDGSINYYLDCDGNTSNGCESAPNTDANCGACATNCSSMGESCEERTNVGGMLVWVCHD